jgi:hypothetical protein
MGPGEEFDHLLADLLAGSLDPDGKARLGRLLREHPDFQAAYLEHVQLHGLLLWRQGVTLPPADPGIRSEIGSAGEPVPLPFTPGSRSGRSIRRRIHWSVAASLLVATTTLCILLAPSRSPASGLDAVEQLVGWSLEIAQARSLPARQEIYDARVGEMQSLLSGSGLSHEDRALAETLVATSEWLTANDDPVAEAERFGEIAEQMLGRLDSASSEQDAKRVTLLADAYRRVTEVGVSRNLDRALASAGHDPHRKRRLERLLANDATRARRLEEMMEHDPVGSHKAIHRALKGHQRKQHPGSRGGE